MATVFKRNLLPYTIVLITGVIWSTTFSLAKIATANGAHPIGLAFWHALGGALIMVVICAARKTWPETTRVTLFRIVVIALIGTALPGTLYFYAASRVPSGILSLTIALVPILTYAAALCFRSESFSWARLTGVGCGFLGIILLAQPEALPDPKMLPWVGVALFCAVCYTSENMFVELCVPNDINMEGILLGGLFVSSALLIPFLLLTDSFVPLQFPLGPTEWSVSMMALINCLSYLAFLYLIQNYGAVFASLMGYVVTVAGVGWGIALFKEEHSIFVWLTLSLLLLGMVLVKPRTTS